MYHELPAMEQQDMKERVDHLEAMLIDMGADFAKCAKDNISPCFFCANDEICNGCPESCHFIWKPHN